MNLKHSLSGDNLEYQWNMEQLISMKSWKVDEKAIGPCKAMGHLYSEDFDFHTIFICFFTILLTL